jgi:pimeloyl-[acyl-carrier protein] methyl ester esterase
MKLVFLHGWGFDASLWDAVRRALAPLETVAWDRGYFGGPRQESVETPFVAIGHSLGSLLLATDPPPRCTGLVAINGFDKFTGDGLVAPRLLDRMRARFRVEPNHVLGEFRERAGGGVHAGMIDTVRLSADLDRLADLDARGRTPPRLVLHGGLDPILPIAMRDTVFTAAPRETHDQAGHLLPLTHPEWVADRIREALS